MHEQNNQFQGDQQPVITAQPQPIQPMPGVKMSASGIRYASFGRRLVALLIDSILVGFTLGLLGAIIFPSNTNGVRSGYSYGINVLSLVYMIFLTSKYGATLGKKAMKIRVQKVDTGENLSFFDAILREFVGKILSSLVFGLGYLWVIWDKDKQAWHDKIANSVVVEV